MAEGSTPLIRQQKKCPIIHVAIESMLKDDSLRTAFANWGEKSLKIRKLQWKGDFNVRSKMSKETLVCLNSYTSLVFPLFFYFIKLLNICV